MIKPVLVALGLILSLVWLLQSLRFLDFIINKGLGIGTFLELTLMLVPRLLEIVWPLALFAGVLYALRRWQDDNEMVALLGAGVSPYRLLRPLLLVGLLGMAVGWLNSWWLLPAATTAFKDLQHDLRNEQGHLLLEEGTFNQLGDDIMVYLHRRVGLASFEGLLVHDTRNPERPVTWIALEGDVETMPDGRPLVLLKEGLRQEVGEQRVEMLQFGAHTLDVSQRFAQANTGPRMRESEEYGWNELNEASRTDPELRAEWHKRLLWPVAAMLGVLIAAGWLLRAPLPRQSSTRLVVGASVSCVVMWVGLLTAFNLGKDGDVPVLHGQWLLVAAIPLLALLGMRRRQ